MDDRIPDFEEIRYSIVYAVMLGHDTPDKIWTALGREEMPGIIENCVMNGWVKIDKQKGTLRVPMKGLVFIEDYYDWEYSTCRRAMDEFDPHLLAEYRRRRKAGKRPPALRDFTLNDRPDLLNAMAKDRRVWCIFKEYPELFGYRGKLRVCNSKGYHADFLVDPKTGKVANVGRNDPCPCGSGKKFKHCCLDSNKISLKGT